MHVDEHLYIVGHQNPDTDSIVAAIAYAHLKNRVQDKKAVACRCGKINNETAFVLERFQQEEPVYLPDVKARAKDLLQDQNKLSYTGPQTSLREAGQLMRDKGIKTLAIADDRQKLLGLFTVGDLANLLLQAWDTGNFPLDAQVGRFMRTGGLVLFQDADLVEEIRPTMLETRFRNYPVVDSQHRFQGMIARYNLLALRGKQLILVDHNEKSQAVPGVEQAEVIEIVDHHRIADVQTPEPIMMRNEPVGSTATIICKMFYEHGLLPPPEIAGLLCAAILSDTLIFKSPTTSQADKKYAAAMADIARIDPVEFGRLMFKAGGNLSGRSARDIIFEDFKEFQLGSSIVGIGQIEIVDSELVREKRRELLAALQDLQQEKGYDLAIMMLTDLMREGTEVLYAGRQSRVMEQAFNLPGSGHSIFLPGVMSRKKQIVPPLSRCLN